MIKALSQQLSLLLNVFNTDQVMLCVRRVTVIKG